VLLLLLLQTLAYLLPALTLALRRAEAAYRRRQAVLARSSSNGRGRVTLREEDMWTVQVGAGVPCLVQLCWGPTIGVCHHLRHICPRQPINPKP